MRCYIAISFEHRTAMQPVLNCIKAVLERHGITPFVFCEQYIFETAQEREMMQQAFRDIDGCGLLIAEVSHKAIGVGLEVGYAKGKNKPVLYLRRSDAPHSTTVGGASDHQIIYTNEEDLKSKLGDVIATYCKL